MKVKIFDTIGLLTPTIEKNINDWLDSYGDKLLFNYSIYQDNKLFIFYEVTE